MWKREVRESSLGGKKKSVLAALFSFDGGKGTGHSQPKEEEEKNKKENKKKSSARSRNPPWFACLGCHGDWGEEGEEVGADDDGWFVGCVSGVAVSVFYMFRMMGVT